MYISVARRSFEEHCDAGKAQIIALTAFLNLLPCALHWDTCFPLGAHRISLYPRFRLEARVPSKKDRLVIRQGSDEQVIGGNHRKANSTEIMIDGTVGDVFVGVRDQPS
jgi:hypothetical protein